MYVASHATKAMATFTSPMHTVPYFPDDMTLPQFMLDYHHPIRLHRGLKTPWLVGGTTGKCLLEHQVRERTWNLASGLSSRFSIGPDCIVGIICPNHIDFPVAIWAAHRLGASVFTANPTYTVNELVPQLVDMKPALLLVHPSALATVRSAASKVGISHETIILFDTPEEKSSGTTPTLQDIVNHGKTAPRFSEFQLKPGEAKTKIALYFPSSGTTGVPKMVAIPHSSFIANVIQTAAHDAGVDMSIPVADRRFRPGDISCAVLPFFHIFGLLINLHYMLFSGMTVVVMPRFEFLKYLAAIEKYKVTNLSLVPQMLTLFCKHPAVKNADLSSLRVVFVGGAPLSVPLAEAMGKIVPHAVVEQGYGMTELTGILTMPPLNRRIATHAVGHLLPGFTARVVKHDGALAERGESGELYVAGPSLATHYVNNEKISRETFLNGWVRTGDEVYFDENDELHVVDRIKDFIKVGGFQVAPAELEARLVMNTDVTDCCVVPVPHEFSGEVPKAYVVLSARARERIQEDPKEGEKIKAALLQDIAANLTKYKALLGGVDFIDVIPKTPSGKLLRRALRVISDTPQGVLARGKRSPSSKMCTRPTPAWGVPVT
ncbi:phenylacetyl-CoA ligase [Mycena belliarum]|uniref:Phenylacetyl-CoA ligase n=1 Tax=Mycena belliarum TaxID=1033014 RepID=A0AAD6XWR8_9AGAR|nr:phenylacetyl-CoA ligase [Mycena belliae]